MSEQNSTKSTTTKREKPEVIDLISDDELFEVHPDEKVLSKSSAKKGGNDSDYDTKDNDNKNTKDGGDDDDIYVDDDDDAAAYGDDNGKDDGKDTEAEMAGDQTNVSRGAASKRAPREFTAAMIKAIVRERMRVPATRKAHRVRFFHDDGSEGSFNVHDMRAFECSDDTPLPYQSNPYNCIFKKNRGTAKSVAWLFSAVPKTTNLFWVTHSNT